MALRLSAVNRWCVTGTPIQKGVEGRFSVLVVQGSADPGEMLHGLHCLPEYH